MFEVFGKLGAGGMADVFLARAELGGKKQIVALKRMRFSLETQSTRMTHGRAAHA